MIYFSLKGNSEFVRCYFNDSGKFECKEKKDDNKNRVNFQFVMFKTHHGSIIHKKKKNVNYMETAKIIMFMFCVLFYVYVFLRDIMTLFCR